MLLGILGGGKIIGIGLAGLAIAGIIGAGYWHYTGLLEQISVLTTNNVKLESSLQVQGAALDTAVETVNEWSRAQKELLKRIDELQEVAENAKTETRRLDKIFARHDLELLALRKPGLIERRINRGTSAALRLFECATGAVNSYCPSEAGEAVRAATTPGPGSSAPE